jgi:hypothetical protein
LNSHVISPRSVEGTRTGARRRSVLAKTALDGQMAELAREASHRTLALWACDCAERVQSYFDRAHPADARPRLAIEAGRRWAATGKFEMREIRRLTLAAHASARSAKEFTAARSAARAAGQAVATAHASGHALAAAIYAATAVRDAALPAAAERAVARERLWQLQHLRRLAHKKTGQGSRPGRGGPTGRAGARSALAPPARYRAGSSARNEPDAEI